MSTVAELVSRLRDEFLDDAVAAIEEDYRWRTSDIVAALSWAHDNLARRLLLIEDSTTAAVCQLTISAAVDGTFPRTASLSSKVLRVERLKYPGITKPLVQASVGFLDQFDPGWDEALGNPTHFTVNPRSRVVTFNRQPVSGGTVSMTVKRLPLTPFAVATIDTDTPEIEYEDAMLRGAVHILYGKDDKKTFDPTRSRLWAGKYEESIREIIADQAALNPQYHLMTGMDY